MRRIPLLMAIFTFLFATTLEGSTSSRLSIKGKAENETLKLLVEFVPAEGSPDLAGLLVRSAPSKRILLAHWNASQPHKALRDAVDLEEPFATVEGEFGSSFPAVKIPFEIAGDGGILVEAVLRDGTRHVISAAQVDLAMFSFTTQVDLDRPKTSESL